MKNHILDRISSPEDLKGLSVSELEELCGEVREEIIQAVSRNGGHLSPNLGTVELGVVLERVFNDPYDKILWDVGHQAYVHKILTGRKNQFHGLRKTGGLSGFLSPEESPYDTFYTGHAGVAISEALGIAEANAAMGRKDAAVVAVIGDGSLGCGIALEALNYIRETKEHFILVINDNKMAISRSVGAFSNYLNRVITGRRYNRFKTRMKKWLRRYSFGKPVIQLIRKLERVTKSFFVSGAVFEELGMKYVGPINGHDLPELLDKFTKIREISGRSVVVHVITEKGHGCSYSEKDPEQFHGSSPFDPANGKVLKKSDSETFSDAFSCGLADLGKEHGEVVAVTAAMASGTKLNKFQEQFPQRFYDVGIAEEHALVFASGLAAGGLRPVVAIYATFLQRALDCVFHDICLQNLPVILGVDRSGIVEDGPTHHGIYDLGFLQSLPNLQIYLPADGSELREMLNRAYQESCPVILRYPRGCADPLGVHQDAFIPGKSSQLIEGKDISIWCAGRECITGIKSSQLFEQYGVRASVVNIRSLKPFDKEYFLREAEKKVIVTIEDSVLSGGVASMTDSLLIHHPHRNVFHFGWPHDEFVPHGSINDLRQTYGMTPEHIVESVLASSFPEHRIRAAE